MSQNLIEVVYATITSPSERAQIEMSFGSVKNPGSLPPSGPAGRGIGVLALPLSGPTGVQVSPPSADIFTCTLDIPAKLLESSPSQ